MAPILAACAAAALVAENVTKACAAVSEPVVKSAKESALKTVSPPGFTARFPDSITISGFKGALLCGQVTDVREKGLNSPAAEKGDQPSSPSSSMVTLSV
jgi:hypothetical protein